MRSARALVVAPHAMDEVLGCGGALMQLAATGATIRTLVLCGDGTGRDGPRRDAAKRAAAILGIDPPSFCGFAENRSDAVPLVELVGRIEAAVGEFRPDTVLVSHGGNLNVDHQNAWRATMTALRPVPGHPVRRVYGYEIASSTDWAPPGWGEPFRPQMFVNIAAYLDRKLAALAAYGDEMRPAPHARSPEAVRALAASRGMTVGLPAAEAFAVVRAIHTADA
ncbi:MAG: PIG-L family deacetylase [Proteobacteria bacterium]|nr:PIG-L family deacetylase [Pseudomonadota bacterium]